MTNQYESQRDYAVIIDDIRIDVIALTPQEYATDWSMQRVKEMMAAHYKCPAHYFKLKWLKTEKEGKTNAS